MPDKILSDKGILNAFDMVMHDYGYDIHEMRDMEKQIKEFYSKTLEENKYYEERKKKILTLIMTLKILNKYLFYRIMMI